MSGPEHGPGRGMGRGMGRDDLLRRAAEAPLTGTMAMTLGHELAQPLSALSMRLDDAIRLLKTGDPATALARVEKAAADAAYAAQVVARVRALGKQQGWTLAPTPLPPVIDGALGLLEPQLEAVGVRVARALPPGLPPALGDAVMLQQVLVNLCRNAVEAMAASPRRELAIGARASREGGRTGREVVTVTIEDTGAGMGAEARARAGEAFFTTKKTGTGLGLSACRTIAALHKGRLWHTPREGGGTVFSLSLPKA